MGLSEKTDKEYHPRLYKLKEGLQLMSMIGLMGSVLSVGAVIGYGCACFNNPFKEKDRRAQDKPASFLEQQVMNHELSPSQIYTRQQEANIGYALLIGAGFYLGSKGTWKISKKIEGHLNSIRPPEVQRPNISTYAPSQMTISASTTKQTIL